MLFWNYNSNIAADNEIILLETFHNTMDFKLKQKSLCGYYCVMIFLKIRKYLYPTIKTYLNKLWYILQQIINAGFKMVWNLMEK